MGIYSNLRNAPVLLNDYITAKYLPDHWRLPEYKNIGDKDQEEEPKDNGDNDQEEETQKPEECKEMKQTSLEE